MSKSLALCLTFLAVAGGVTLHGFSIRNGMSDMIEAARVDHLLTDGTPNPYRGKLTGIGPVDFMLFTLVNFFWPLAQGETPGLTLIGLQFAGQLVPLFTVMMIEGFRTGNKGRAVSFIGVYSFLIQTGGFAIFSPLYLALYVYTSPTYATPTASNLIVLNVDAMPFGLLFGYLPLSIITGLPYPSILSLKQKIWAIILWQPTAHYAIYISQILSSLSPHKTKTSSIPRQLMHLRAAYKFALLLSVPIHLLTWILSLTSLVWTSLFTVEAAASLHPMNALIPMNPLKAWNTKAVDITQGSHWLLQWDYWIGSLAYFVFAVAAKSNVSRKLYLKDGVAAVGRMVLLGPVSAALTLLWERDELVLGKAEGKEKKIV